MPRTFWVETLGCPKNQVDSDKLVGTLLADGLVAGRRARRRRPRRRQHLRLHRGGPPGVDRHGARPGRPRGDGAGLVVTGCLAERYGAELAERAARGRRRRRVRRAGDARPKLGARRRAVPALDLLNLPRPAPAAPWAYVKVAEGCDKACGFCAIPSFRGPQRSRSIDDDPRRGRRLAAAACGRSCSSPRTSPLRPRPGPGRARDRPAGRGGRRAGSTGCGCSTCTRPTSPTARRRDLRHRRAVLRPLAAARVAARCCAACAAGATATASSRRIDDIRAGAPDAAFRSNFIVGYPGETEADHDELLAFVDAAQLDWCGFFAYSREEGTYAAGLDGEVAARRWSHERLAELRERQDAITAAAT